MRRIVIAALTLIMIIMISTVSIWGFAVGQAVNVVVPDTGSLTLSQTSMVLNFPSIDTWTGDTYTLTSPNFLVSTHHSGPNNPDIVVTSTALQNGTYSIPLQGFRVYLTYAGSQSSGTLDHLVTFPNIGKGNKTATAHYDLTVKSDQQAGTYHGTVTFTLVDI